ncbi:MAG: ABC transporter ATP-binding protein [Planctomycetota bacterium]
MRPLLEIRDFSAGFVTDHEPVAVVDGVSLQIPHGQTVALVGESGCGKSVTALSILRLLPVPPARILGGEIFFHDPHSDGPIDLLRAPISKMRKIRGGRIAMIFQDPMSALNPVYTIGEQIREAVELHTSQRGKTARQSAVEMLAKVGIAAPQRRFDEYPHQMSGGMLQRAMIAMALSCKPALLIADEPTTALDVTVQAQVLQLLRDCKTDRDMSLLLITHDLSVVANIADQVYIMYAGRIVEQGPCRQILDSPRHAYTRRLLDCVPKLGGSDRARVRTFPQH